MTTEAELFDALKYHVVVAPDGTRKYYNSAGKLHCEEGPAVEYAGGSKEWWQNGLRHCDTGPAVEWANTTEWWLNGTSYTEQDYYAQLKTLGHTV